MKTKFYRGLGLLGVLPLCMRYSDGGAAPAAESNTPPATPTNAPSGTVAIPPAAPPATPVLPVPPTVPPASPAVTPPAETGKSYTDSQLDELKAQWQKDFEASKEAEKDFAKMTPEQKAQKLLDDQKAETSRLQAQLADRDLTDYTRAALVKAELPPDALSFVKGMDQAATDTRIKAFGALLAAGIQAGVDKRFKSNGYTPRLSAAGSTPEAGQKRARGVSVK